ncbi:MAG: hypothetical protein RL088_2945 [Verrucomicrobiota bacterium]|jgi:transcription termination factor Rho
MQLPDRPRKFFAAARNTEEAGLLGIEKRFLFNNALARVGEIFNLACSAHKLQ